MSQGSGSFKAANSSRQEKATRVTEPIPGSGPEDTRGHWPCCFFMGSGYTSAFVSVKALSDTLRFVAFQKWNCPQTVAIQVMWKEGSGEVSLMTNAPGNASETERN